MGSCKTRTKLKAFVISALLGLAAAAPAPAVSSHQVIHGHGAVVSHGTAHHGLVAHGTAHHGLVAHPVAHHGLVAHTVAHHGLVAHPVAHHGFAAHPVAHHGLVAHPVVHHGLVAHPVAHAIHVAPVVHHAPVVHATAYVAGVVSGSYDVALPDGRTQHVKYTSDNYNGYVADVTYDGVAVYPEAAPYVAAPAPAYHA